MESLTCSGRFVSPFVRALASYPGLPAAGLARLRVLAAQERVPLTDAGQSLESWVRHCRDENLGLRAGRAMQLGLGGPLDYAMSSAASLRQSMQVAMRYCRLYSDALLPKLEQEGERAIIRLDSKLPWQRVVADFTLSTWYATHLKPHREHARDPLGRRLALECCFAHGKPADVSEYERAFDGSTLRFDAGFYGFVLDAAAIDAPLLSADVALHAAHIEHLEVLHAQLDAAAPRNIEARVRQALGSDLRCSFASADRVARALHMSRRTLARRLDGEGTTFSEVLDTHRRELGVRYVARTSLPLGEISERLGFSQVQGFGRAFRRWTGRSPLEYRNAARKAAA
jgi:AraC-like DNA-binding protein